MVIQGILDTPSKSPSLGWGEQPHVKACVYHTLGEGNCKVDETQNFPGFRVSGLPMKEPVCLIFLVTKPCCCGFKCHEYVKFSWLHIELDGSSGLQWPLGHLHLDAPLCPPETSFSLPPTCSSPVFLINHPTVQVRDPSLSTAGSSPTSRQSQHLSTTLLSFL